MNFRHISIDPKIPGEGWGVAGTGVADFNADGKLDVAISRRSIQTAFWYRQISPEKWSRHVIGSHPVLGTGDILPAIACDMTGNGLPDMVFSSVWFENPGTLAANPDAPWTPHLWPGSGHDIVLADLHRTGTPGLLVYDGKTLTFYDRQNNLAPTILIDGRNDHGGIAPRGIGDLDGDGLPDIVLPGIWLKNPGNTRDPWTPIPWPHIGVEKATYGPSIRSWVVDLIGSGSNDIVYSDCDTGWCHVYWARNLDHGRSWQITRLPDPPGNPETGSFHSLAVADFDSDGQLEIFAAEQEDATTQKDPFGLKAMKPQGLQERGVLWKRSADGIFVPRLISEGPPGWHDAVAAPIAGSPRLDLVSKIWNTDSNVYHVDLWINESSA